MPARIPALAPARAARMILPELLSSSRYDMRSKRKVIR
jgi:hypothetical protein